MSGINVHRVVGNLLVGTSHFFVDTTTNRVGVNTSSPSASLDIATGDLKVGSDITIGNSGTITAANFSGNGSGLSDINSDSGSWINGASSNIHLAVSTDKVGIGVENPQNTLVAAGGVTFGPGASTTNATYHSGTVNIIGGGTRALLRIENNNGIGSPGIIFGEGSNFTEDTVPTIKKVQGTNNLAIMTSGNLGLGTSSPDGPLHVTFPGNSNFTGITYQNSDVKTVLGNTANDSTNTSFIQVYASVANSVPDANSSTYNLALQPFGGSVGIGTHSPGHVLDIQGSQAYDGSTTLRVLNPASQHGRTQLHLVGRYEGGNDGWSAGGARNAIMFKSQTTQNSNITNQWTIQSFPNGTNNELGFLAGSDNTPKVVFRGDTGDVSLSGLFNLGVHSTAPSNPVNGSMYYNTTSNSLQLYKNGWAAISVFIPTDISGLVGWYLPENWNGSTWVDASGSGNNSASSVGTIQYSATQSGGGATNSFPILYGDINTKINFPTAICPSTYTIIYLTRYYSTPRGRILDSQSNNWLSGHWNGFSGLAYHGGWMTQSSSSTHGSNWVLGVDQNYLFRHKSSGIAWSQHGGGGGNYPHLRIGSQGYEPSNWQCAEICVYNRHLSSDEYTTIASYMENKFGIT